MGIPGKSRYICGRDYVQSLGEEVICSTKASPGPWVGFNGVDRFLATAHFIFRVHIVCWLPPGRYVWRVWRFSRSDIAMHVDGDRLIVQSAGDTKRFTAADPDEAQRLIGAIG